MQNIEEKNVKTRLSYTLDLRNINKKNSEPFITQYSNAFKFIDENDENVTLNELANTPDYTGTDGNINIYIDDDQITLDSNKYKFITGLYNSLRNIRTNIYNQITDQYTEDDINNIIELITNKLISNQGSNNDEYSFLLESKNNIRYSKQLILKLLQTDFYNLIHE